MPPPCDDCSKGASGAGSGAPSNPTDRDHKDERAFKVYSRRVKINGGTAQPQIVASVPAAAAIDVFARYRDDSGNVEDPFGGNEPWTVFAINQNTRSQVGPSRTTDMAPASDGVQRRLFAIRDVPAESFDIELLPTGVPAGSTAMFDVVVVAWAREPTGIGPFGLTSVVDGDTASTDLTSGLAVMGQDAAVATPPWRPLTFNQTAVYNPAAEGTLDARTNLNVLPVGLFRAAAPALNDGDLFPLQVDASGNLKVAVTSVTSSSQKFVSAAYESNHVSAGAKTLQSVYVSSKAAAAGFVFIFDAAALPANGTLPDFPPIPIPAGPAFISADGLDRRCVTGVVVAFSSTQASLTISTADLWIEGHF